MNDELIIDSLVKEKYPGMKIGVITIEEVDNGADTTELKTYKEAAEEELRKKLAHFTRKELDALPSIQPYTEYYGRFDKTYHVRLQLESILSGKSIPMVSPLVTSMFVAELKYQLLTAGHDLDVCEPPFAAQVAKGNETYTGMSGKTQIVKLNDMFIADRKGIISNILYGPDQRTKITSTTTRALFTVYAPSGIEEELLTEHLQDIAHNVRLTNPAAVVSLLNIYHS